MAEGPGGGDEGAEAQGGEQLVRVVVLGAAKAGWEC